MLSFTSRNLSGRPKIRRNFAVRASL